eukprot:gb/GECH01008515.1/.p1 GENE.gb/GECH01008515.1/~~gb/GECH01008515.1/.p1  ORF type:complete len:1242 (+),score=283.29 gb/GECH01008515.1/:1-3726(+)
MRNLIRIRENHRSLNLHGGNIVGYTSVDEHTYFGVTKQGFLFGFDVSNDKVFFEANLKEFSGDNPPAIDEDAKIIAIQYVAELESICMASNSGDIILYEMSSGLLDCVGSIDAGFTCMSWSPDQDVVVFTTGASTVIVMTKEWEVLEENSLFGEDAGSPEDDEPRAIESAEQPVFVSWRGDGNYFAVNCYDPNENARRIRVWERSAIYHSKCETQSVVHDSLSWRPEGSIITTHQYLSNKDETNIIFFERNGLQHYEFCIQKGNAHVMDVKWSPESDVLAVLLTPHDQDHPILQLWTRRNYHWYLKQQIEHSSAVDYMCWDSESSLLLHVFCAGGKYLCYDFSWDVIVSSGLSKDNAATAAVIDGKSLLLTPFRYNVPPPPSCTASMQFDSPINCVSFHQTRLMVQLSNGNVHFHETEPHARPPKFGLPPKEVFSLTDRHHTALSSLRLIKWLSPHLCLGVKPSTTGNTDDIVRVIFSESGDDEEVLHIPMKDSIIALAYNEFTGNVFAETTQGELFYSSLSIDNGSEFRPWHYNLPKSCAQLGLCMMAGEETVLGLNTRGPFYVNGIAAATNISSFAIHDQFLLLTTLTHKLRIISLDSTPTEAVGIISTIPTSTYDETIREIENGGRLVAVVPQSTRVVLQMPRGNLEMFFPRALVLNHIRNLLNDFDYRKAFLVARKHMIDLNILYDHNPAQFLERCEEFVRKVNNANYLNIFVSQIRDEDTTHTLFSSYETPASSEPEGKVNRVCLALRDALNTVDASRFITTIITTYARYHPPQLEDALALIRSLREAETEALTEDPDEDIERPSANTALEYLIFLTDVNHLYDVALGMYDFELVLMVAQKSQKDPKEYLPFLRQLQQMEKYYQQYSIDMYLKRYDSALRNLAKAGEQYFDDCKRLIQQQELYQVGLDIYSDDTEKRDQILELYGDFLSIEYQYSQAGFAYLECEKLDKALEAFKDAGEYRYALSVAAKLQYTGSDFENFARELADSLDQMSCPRDAAYVLQHYAKDSEEAVMTVIEAHYWDDAIHIAYAGNRADLLETNVLPAVKDAYSSKIDDLESHQKKFDQFISRLKEIRSEPPAFAIGGVENSDMFSETSSAFSEYSGISSSSYSSQSSSSSRSSKKSKKKKRHKLKKGSVYEEPNLVDRLRKLVPKSIEQNNVSCLVRGLMFFKLYSEAKELHQKFNRFMELCKSHEQLIDAPLHNPLPEEDEDIRPKDKANVSELIGSDCNDWKLAVLE